MPLLALRHRVQQFKLSTDPKFIDKLRDVVGLYVDPPAHAIVLSVDEKSQIQALDRSQPGLPMKKGRAGTMTHDYKRQARLFALRFEWTAPGSRLSTCASSAGTTRPSPSRCTSSCARGTPRLST